MLRKDEIKTDLSTLVNENRLIVLSLAEPTNISQFSQRYQKWYTNAKRIVAQLAPDRLDEFCSFYEADAKRKYIDVVTYRIQDFARGIAKSPDARDHFNAKDVIAALVISQGHILESVESRIDSVLADVQGTLISQFLDEQLVIAKQLQKTSLRAAGALAGVVLEDHLQRIAKNHNIAIAKKDPTIGDLNDPLRSATIYDVAAWRKIQYLADIRNICSHRKDIEPSKQQVDELIDGVNWALKNIY